MRLVLLGAPGSGKGTQGEKIAKEHGILRLSTGDILRAAIKDGTELGREAASFMNQGGLVPDKLVLRLMSERIRRADCRNGYILDGFPRTVGQAEGLDEILKRDGSRLDAVINIEVSEAEVLKRLGGRRQCSKCGAVYHDLYSPSKRGDLCDRCESPLYQRDDDREETIRNRLKVYREETTPLIGYYKGILQSVDGGKDPSEVFAQISSLIGKKGSAQSFCD